MLALRAIGVCTVVPAISWWLNSPYDQNRNYSRRSAPCRTDVGETWCCGLGGETFEAAQAWKVIETRRQAKLTMDPLRTSDDLKSLIETAQKLIDTWDEDPDNYSKLEQHLKELKAAIEKSKDWSDYPSNLRRKTHLQWHVTQRWRLPYATTAVIATSK